MMKLKAFYKGNIYTVVKIDSFHEVVQLADDFGYMTDDIPTNDVTILQLSGLIDKNGLEIWEGCIVKVEMDDETFIVVVKKQNVNGSELAVLDFEEIGAIEAYRYKEPCENTLILAAMQPDTFKLEVIGNIYQNPDLLKTN